MRYKIYELDTKRKPSDRWKKDNDTIDRLMQLELPFNMDDTYNSPAEAEQLIAKNPDIFKNKTLAIIPIIVVNFEGKIIQ